MFARMTAAAALIALAGCAGMESAGRSSRTGEPTRVASAPPAVTPAPTPAPAAAPAPVVRAPAPTQPATAPPPAAQTPAPSVATPPPAQARAPVASPAPAQRAATTPPPTDEDDEPVATASRGDVIVPGARQRQVPAPGGDPRSNAERMQDIRAWDQCVMRVQAAGAADPLRPQLTTPEEYCRTSLGMANRTSVPASRLERQR